MMQRHFAQVGTILLCLFFSPIQSATIGDFNALLYEQSPVTMLSGQDNCVQGFTALTAGLTLENATTTCTYDAMLPLGLNLELNGGALYLDKDLNLSYPITIPSTGTIIGNCHAIHFPYSPHTLYLPGSGGQKAFNPLLSRIDDYLALSMDWSFDDRYVVSGSIRQGKFSKLEVLTFDGKSLNQGAQLFGDQHIRCVSWHPTSYKIAVGSSHSRCADNLEVYEYVPDSKEIIKIAGDTIEYKDINALSWHPEGELLAVARNAFHKELSLYLMKDGAFMHLCTTGFDHHRKIQAHALAWDPTGTYLAVGVRKTLSYPELLVFRLYGTTLVQVSSLSINGQINALDWSPHGSMIALGLDNNRACDSLRLISFDHENERLEPVDTNRSIEQRSIVSLQWSNDGDHIAIGSAKERSGTYVTIYSFDKQSVRLRLADMCCVEQGINAIRWSHDDSHLLTGDTFRRSMIYRVSDTFTFDSTFFSFNSDVHVGAPMHFQGECMMSMNNNGMYFAHAQPISVASDSSLVLCNARLYFDQSALAFDEPDAALTLKNCSILSKEPLQAGGQIQFEQACGIGGQFGCQALIMDKSELSLIGTTSLSDAWMFNGTSRLSGHGNVLDLSSSGSLIIGAGSFIEMSDVVIKGLGSGGLVFTDDSSHLSLSNVVIELDDDVTTTIGHMLVNGPTTVITKNNTWHFDTDAKVAVNGVCLWQDWAGSATPGTLAFEPDVLSLAKSATVRVVGIYDYQAEQTESYYDLIVSNSNAAVANHERIGAHDEHLAGHDAQLATIDTGPDDVVVAGDHLLSYNLALGPSHALHFTHDSNFNGGGHLIQCLTAVPGCIVLDNNVTVTMRNVHLNDIMQTTVLLGHGAALYFGDDAHLTLGGSSAQQIFWNFSGTAQIDGNGHTLKVGLIAVDDAAHVTFKDVVVYGLSASNVMCQGPDARLILDNAQLVMTHDFTLKQGGLICLEDSSINGHYRFCYQTNAHSLILPHAKLRLNDGVTFDYQPPSGAKNLMVFSGRQAKLVCDRSILKVAATGLQLTNGTIEVLTHMAIESLATNLSGAVVIGNGLASQDMNITLMPGAQMELVAGFIDYKNSE